jgi:hypothetical protein
MKKVVVGLFFSLVAICSLCAMGGEQSYDGYGSPAPGGGIMSFIPFLFIIIIYVLIGVYVKYDNKKMRGLETVLSYKHNKKSVYVEYRQWKLIWGLMIDSQREVNLVIDEWNDNGYTCIGFQRSFLPNVSIIKMLGILIITVLTLGFVNFYTGPTMLFIHSGSIKGEQTEGSDEGVVKLSKPLWEK